MGQHGQRGSFGGVRRFRGDSVRAMVAILVIVLATSAGVVQPSWSAAVKSVIDRAPAQVFKPVAAAGYQYETTVMGDSPVAYWPCDDGTGSACSDASGNGHSASFVCVYPSNCSALPTWTTKALVGGSGQSVTCCSGSTTCCNVGANAANPFGLPAARSVEAIYACSNPSHCGSPTLFDTNGTSEVKIGVAQTRIVAISGGMGGTCSTSSTLNLYDGYPHLIDLVDDGTHVWAYIDEALCMEVNSADSSDSSVTCVRIIVRCDNAYSIDTGDDLGQISVYNYALTSTQLTAHFNATGFLPGSVSNLVAKGSTNAASLSWTPPSGQTLTPITSYNVTPVTDGSSSTPITVGGNGTGANIPNLPGGASYSFQVQAVDSRGAGPATTSSAVTIGSPTAAPGSFATYLYLRSGQGNGQAYAHYGFVSRLNVPAETTWTWEARLWGFTSTATTGSHMALGWLSGSVSSPSDANPIAGLDFHIGGTSNQTYFVWPGGSCGLASGTGGIAAAIDSSVTTPVHVAESYDGTTVRGFINGTQVCSQATSSASLSAGPFGFMDNAGLAQGFFDEIRVSSVARYTANFTPPTQRFATDSSTNLLWHFDDYAVSKLPSTHILSATGGPSFPITLVPSTYRDASGNLNHANTAWSSGGSSVQGDDDWYRPYSLDPGVTADELTGNGSPWLCPCTINSTARPVNDATGEFWHTFTDFAIPGRMPLDFTRTYSSLRTSTLGPTGYGWTDDYNQYLSFDGSGNATVHNGNGSAVVFTFTSPSTYTAAPSEHVTLVKNQDGTFTLTDTGHNQTVFNAPSSNLSTLAKLVDRHGGAAYTLTLAYNADGTLATVTDPASRTLSFSYTTIGGNKLISSISDSASPARTVSFSYGTNSGDATTYLSLTQVTDVAGGLTKFTYDSSHYLLTMTDPNGGVTTNTYDSSTHRITSQKDPLNRTTSFSYSSFAGSLGLTTTVTDPKGNQVQEEYLNGMLLSRTVGYGTAAAASWTYAYDAGALALTVAAGPNGETTTTVRDSNANVLSSTDGLGRTTSYTYNSFNEPLTITDPLGVTTTNVYNSLGDLTSSSRPLTGTQSTATTSYTYGDSNHPGDVTKMTDPDNNAWTYTYDSYGDRVTSTDPLGDETTYAFDSIGRMTSMVTPNGNVSGGTPANFTWTYTYDAFGNRLTVTDPLSHETVYHYDANQNLDKVTDANGNVTTNVYDADNELTQVKRADSPQTTLTTDYNADGTVLDQKDGKGNAIQTYAYDSLAHVTTITDALSNVTTYVYDAYGDLLSKQDPGGNCSASPATGCTTYGYDAANQVISISYSDGVTPNVSMSYDADGQRTSMTDGTGTSSWSWDSLHRMTAYTNGNGAEVEYAYNLRNLVTTITYPGSLNVTRGYDAAGRWTSVEDWNSKTTTFGYDANSNLTTETFPSASGVVDTTTFNDADQVTAISSVKGGTTLFSASYTRDSNNQLTSDSSAPSASGSYKYTPLNQVCYAGSSNSSACGSPPSGSIAYAYDAADNLTQTGSTQQVFNAADELCWTASTSGSCSSPPSGATTYSYDTRGNRTGVSPSGGQSQTLTFDQANRLTKFAAASTTTYGYNGDGLRMSKSSGGTTTQFLWDVAGSLPLLIMDGSTSYVYGPGGLPLEQVSSSATYWFHHDQIGSTRLLTDGSGTSQETYQFDPYGNLLASTGSITNPLQFGGQYLNTESGLYYLRARYYDPSTGQFLAPDAAVATTRSPYAYVRGATVNVSDPSGLDQTYGGPPGCSWPDLGGSMCPVADWSRINPTPEQVNEAVTTAAIFLDLCTVGGAETGVAVPACEAGSIVCNFVGLSIDVSQGQWGNAGLDAAGMVPGLGSAADDAKLIKLTKTVKHAFGYAGAVSDGYAAGTIGADLINSRLHKGAGG